MVIVEPGGEVRWGNQAAAVCGPMAWRSCWWGNARAVAPSISSSSGVPLAVGLPSIHCSAQAGDGSGVYGIADQLQQLEWRRIQQPGDGYLLLLARDLAPQEQALQQQRQFVNQLAHELNTPLAIVNGSLQQLGKKLLEFGDGSKERLRQAQRKPAGWCGCCAIFWYSRSGNRPPPLTAPAGGTQALAAGMDGPARSACIYRMEPCL